MPNYPDDEDGQVLAHLEAEGVNMPQPLQIDFAVAAPNEAAAMAIGKALTEAGYEVEVSFEEGEPMEEDEVPPEDELGPAWTVYALMTMVPKYEEIMRIQADLDRLATPHGGKSDGWGTMVD